MNLNATGKKRFSLPEHCDDKSFCFLWESLVSTADGAEQWSYNKKWHKSFFFRVEKKKLNTEAHTTKRGFRIWIFPKSAFCSHS